MNTNIKTREYTTISEVSGPLMVVEGVEGVGYNEIVDIETPNGEKRSGQVLEVTDDVDDRVGAAVLGAFLQRLQRRQRHPAAGLGIGLAHAIGLLVGDVLAETGHHGRRLLAGKIEAHAAIDAGGLRFGRVDQVLQRQFEARVGGERRGGGQHQAGHAGGQKSFQGLAPGDGRPGR